MCTSLAVTYSHIRTVADVQEQDVNPTDLLKIVGFDAGSEMSQMDEHSIVPR